MEIPQKDEFLQEYHNGEGSTNNNHTNKTLFKVNKVFPFNIDNNLSDFKDNNIGNNISDIIISDNNNSNIHNTSLDYVNLIKSTNHTNNHSNNHNYPRYCCHYPNCLKEYKGKYNLRKHIRSHAGIFLYRCDYEGCDKTYKIKENLDLHVKNFHLREKPFKCGFCLKKFSHRNGKLYHEKKKHLNILEFKCMINGCNAAFASRSALKYHLNHQHQKECIDGRKM